MYQRNASAPRSRSTDHGSDHVAARLRHLEAVLIDDVREAHDVQVGSPVEDEGVHREQRIEPTARLIDCLADEVGGEVLLEAVGVLERVVELRGGHRARVEPGVEHRRDAGCRTALARRARDRDLVDVRPMQIHAREVAGREIGELGHRAHAGVVTTVTAAPDRDRCSPVAVA
jgi:hypothetical protein